ncbi:DUF4097 family beta strand repeat-containing protein [Ningiella sp. W23]|uniref:DUF4097 family beta strand repeat-containing protein n=1 Tax=Ningiella sp. W23 TaxID=3023715 RepID=UPI0037569B70
MKFKLIAGVCVGCALMLSSGCVISVGSDFNTADVKLDERLELDAEELTSFAVDTSVGDIDIVGVEGQKQIVVLAKIRTTQARDYELGLEKRGTTAFLASHHSSQNGSWTAHPYIDLKVTMPADMALQVEQRSGDMTIKDINQSLKVKDRSGDLHIRNIGGMVDIEDRSGDLSIIDISDSATIRDRSGDLLVRNIEGNVVITDTSGDIEIFNAQGDVEIKDTSGDIDVHGAQSINVIEDGSGDLDYSNIESFIHQSR